MGGLSRAALGGVTLALASGVVGGCRERAQEVQSEAELRAMVRRMMPVVAQAARLPFKQEPVVLRRSRAQVRDYVVHKFEQELPSAEIDGIQVALRLFGLIADTLDLRATMIDLLTEQVAGYYDPDSNALYIPSDIDPFQLRIVVSHELVHALQDQYIPLDSIVMQQGRNDRRTAAQAVLEGQATVAQIPVLMPEQRPETLPAGWFWRQRAVMARQQAQMEEFARAPLWLREGLIFPYLGGAEFVVWFRRTYPDRRILDALPVSTEQILHPDRYANWDEPTEVVMTRSPLDAVRWEDGLGEFEIRLLLQQHLGDETEAALLATGWDGDRYQVLGAPGGGEGDALVWVTVWDDTRAADRFARGLDRAWRNRRTDGRAGRRAEITQLTMEGRPVVRLVDAPADWDGWGRLPAVRLVERQVSR